MDAHESVRAEAALEAREFLPNDVRRATRVQYDVFVVGLEPIDLGGLEK